MSTATSPTPRPTPSPTPRPTPSEVAYRWRWPALLVVLAAEVMDLLDVLVTVIAGPSVLRDLGGSTTFIQWFTAAYTVAMASGLLIGGRLGDMFGRRRVFLIGMAGFAVASLLCTVALSAEMLVATRVVQGFFGAAMIPQGLGLIKEMFPPDEMARAYGLFGPVMGLSSVGGPVLAGWLVDADLLGLGWRMIFAINLPIALVGIVAGLRYLPASSPDPDLRIDLPGSLLATIGMAGLIIPLIQGREHDWPAWSFALIALALAAFVGFAVLERRRDRAGRATLVVPSLFGKRAFTAGLVTGLLFFASLMGISLVVTLFLQLGLGFDPLRAGVAGLPQALGMVVGFLLTQALHVLGRRLMHLGATTVVGGALLLSATIGSAGDAIDAWSLAPGLAIIGVGLGLTMAPFFDIVLAGVSPSESGSASGTLTSVQQIGGALGIAVLGTVFFTPVEDAMPRPTVDTFASATQACLWFAAVFVVGAGLLTFLLPPRAEHFGAH